MNPLPPVYFCTECHDCGLVQKPQPDGSLLIEMCPQCRPIIAATHDDDDLPDTDLWDNGGEG